MHAEKPREGVSAVYKCISVFGLTVVGSRSSISDDLTAEDGFESSSSSN